MTAIVALLFLAAPAFAQEPAAPSAPPASVSGGDKSVVPADYNCVNCHRDIADERLTPPVNDWMESAHRNAGVKCADCHGGNPYDDALSMEKSAGFIGKPKPQDIPKLCSKCHSDAKMMRTHNLRADQFALYSDSVHGRKLASGDTEAPTCISCHGKHKILKVKDPNATVARKNVPETCGVCHSKKEIFEKRGKKADQLELYKKSRHYELFAKGDLMVPTCFDCHGNHDVQAAKTERTRTVCFNCHAQQAEYYKSSKHYTAFKQGGEPVCLHCHNWHDIERPAPEKFTGDKDNDCVGCHDEKSPAYLAGKDLKQVVEAASAAVKSAKRSLDELEGNAHGGFETSDLKEKMAKTLDGLKELHTLTHKLNVEAVKKQSEGLILSAQAISETTSGMRSELKVRRVALVVAWIVFIGFMGALWVKMKDLDKKREE
ncbi:MAG: cytochrome c3 family protein [Nitrospinae bacterium]|nr:cytochrome c3 family protein [Nitrospinota bacterium]